MKKTIYIMWAIILLGALFILQHRFSPTRQTLIPAINITNPDDQTLNTQEIFNQNTEELINIGDKYFNYNYPEKAVNYYLKALEKQRDSLTLLRKLAEAYLASNQGDKAVDTLKTALAFKPNSENLNLLLARSYIANRQIEEAKNLIWKLAEAKPENRYYKSIIYLLYGEYNLAQETLKTLRDLETQNQEQLQIKEKTLNLLNAFNTFSYYKESDPAFLNLLIAKALGENQEHHAAIPILFAIITENSNYRDAWIVLGYNYLMTHQHLNAVDALKQANDLDPQKPQTLFYLGLAHFASNNIEQAIEYLKKAQTAGYTPLSQIQIKLGDLYSIQKNFKKSESYYQKTLEENAPNLNLYARMVWLKLDKLNQPKEALNLALKATEHFPDQALSHSLAGWAYTALGNYGQAKKYLNTALQINPDLDQVNFHIAWLYQKQGQTKLAKDYYKQAFILGNGNEISVLSAQNFNKLNKEEQKSFFQTNITSP